MIWTAASQRLGFSKLPVTSGDHSSLQRYHHLMNARSTLQSFSCSITPHVSSSWTVICWAAGWGGKCSGTTQQERWCSKDTAWRYFSAAAQSWSPRLPESPAKQTAIPAMWFKPAHIPACLNSQEVQVPALTSSLKNSFESLKNMVYGFNHEEKQQLCCTLQYAHMHNLHISKGYSKIICTFAFRNLALPNPSRFLCNSFGCILALVSLRWAGYMRFKAGLRVDRSVDKVWKLVHFPVSHQTIHLLLQDQNTRNTRKNSNLVWDWIQHCCTGRAL